MKKNQGSEAFLEAGQQLSKLYIDTEPPLEKNKPKGPFQTVSEEQEGNLLLFVPRNEISRAINDLTGKYGYSHLAVDCGEIDVSSGRRVMIEATMGAGVHYAFQDEYGRRSFVRIPLQKTGIDVGQFCACVHARVGEKFDNLEAITLGILDNPARQICSDLVTVCLPQEMREEIARCHHRAVIHPLAAVRDERPGTGFRLFMSPNGFAEFLGAPRGNELKERDQLAEPHLQASNNATLLPRLWKWGDTLVTSAWRHLTDR
ncbi:MAG TPA: hypothetical protein VK249_03060 [Anaerolineales bacterium]|nr:hypothetical protein [Anaerolineales bacterium]